MGISSFLCHKRFDDIANALGRVQHHHLTQVCRHLISPVRIRHQLGHGIVELAPHILDEHSALIYRKAEREGIPSEIFPSEIYLGIRVAVTRIVFQSSDVIGAFESTNFMLPMYLFAPVDYLTRHFLIRI